METENIRTDNERKPGRLIWFILRIAIAAGIILWLIGKGYSDLAEAIRQFNFVWLLPAMALYFLHLLVCGWRWKLLLKVQNIKISFFESFSLIMKGFFFSLVLPGGAIGGDIARAGLIASKAPKGSRFEGTFSILMDRYVGMLALFSFAIVVIAVSLPVLREVKGVMEMAVYALVLGAFCGLGTGLVMLFIHKIEKITVIAFLISLADRYSKGMVSRLTRTLDIYRNSVKTVILAIVVSIFLIHINMVAVVYCIARGISHEKISADTMLVAVTIGNTAGLIPLTPSGVGTRDAIMKTLLQAGGFSKADAVGTAIIYTAIILSFNLFGGIFFIFASDFEKNIYIRKEEN